MKKTDRVIELLREMMVANAPGTGGGFGTASPASGPVAGKDARIGSTDAYTGKKGKVDYRKVPVTYRNWVKSLGKSFGKII